MHSGLEKKLGVEVRKAYSHFLKLVMVIIIDFKKRSQKQMTISLKTIGVINCILFFMN